MDLFSDGESKKNLEAYEKEVQEREEEKLANA